ncbi:amino acid transporter [Aeromicrobium sp. SORGH_AS981]|uniref:APC family permease n=1 Tax=Aeromicrobium sp. SORGH_AS_0981 TaxID=3041802 RepID=UPI00285B3D55|nr:APC family permease [Aeromicrobium sp. SORGH_AS_0981]MDR6119399.1 amino acid transporter [Aeromicrobium sp. SORGH_AS_0981]
MTTETAGVQGPTELRRVMGPKLLLLFIVGDILGAGIYAVTGQMAGKVGGLVWLPFLLAFVVASMTALSYLELVTKYPQAAGAALYAHKAFGIHFVTFLIAFAVVCSGITSASTSAKTLADNFTGGLDVNGWTDGPASSGTIVAIAMAFMILLAIINLRGVGESVKFNVVLTIVELAALSIVIGVGFYAMTRNGADLSEVVTFRDYEDRGLFLAVTAATSIAFFAMVGFEDAVNMVEEVKEPNKIFPRTMLTGLGIAVLLYMLVAVSVVTVLTAPELKDISDSEGRALLEVVSKGAPDFPIDRVFPFLAVFAVANTALINMLMASRLLYGMAKQGVLPPSARSGAARTPHSVGGRRVQHAARARPDLLRHARRREQRGGQPVERHRVPAAVRLRRRERRVPDPAPQPGRREAEPLRVPGRPACGRGRAVRVPRRSLGRAGRSGVRHRGCAHADRRRALGHHLRDQPDHRQRGQRVRGRREAR